MALTWLYALVSYLTSRNLFVDFVWFTIHPISKLFSRRWTQIDTDSKTAK